jgi:hypothetical protein
MRGWRRRNRALRAAGNGAADAVWCSHTVLANAVHGEAGVLGSPQRLVGKRTIAAR